MCLRGLGGGGGSRLEERRAVLEIVDMCGVVKDGFTVALGDGSLEITMKVISEQK